MSDNITPSPLEHAEQLRLVGLLDSCSNRFGPFSNQVGTARLRKLIHRAFDAPGPIRWGRVKLLYVAWNPEGLTFQQSAWRFSEFTGAGFPSREQMFAALTGATR